MEIEGLYTAIFDFVKNLDREYGRLFPVGILFKIRWIRNSYLTPQVKALVKITDLRQTEPYPTERHLYPTKLTVNT
jgi:hypothetical protein